MMALLDWPKFDEKKHVYVIATAGGDGWTPKPPLSEAIRRDIYHATDGDVVQWEDWIDILEVYEKNDENIPIAIFNLGTWEWEPGPERPKRPTWLSK